MLFGVLFYDCNSSKKITTTKQTQQIADDNTDGATIISKSDCLTCHSQSERRIGPSWNDVAKKYHNASEAGITKLSEKIRKGGAGSWGSIPMAPHPGLSKAKADSIINYILLKYN